jgi:hypothetical protein
VRCNVEWIVLQNSTEGCGTSKDRDQSGLALGPFGNHIDLRLGYTRCGYWMAAANHGVNPHNSLICNWVAACLRVACCTDGMAQRCWSCHGKAARAKAKILCDANAWVLLGHSQLTRRTQRRDVLSTYQYETGAHGATLQSLSSLQFSTLGC